MMWMELDGSMLSEIGQEEKDKYQMILLMCRVQQHRKTDGNKQQQNHRTREWTNRYQREMYWAGWVIREG